MSAWIRRHQLPVYFGVAYAVSWSIAVPLALQAQGVLDTHLPWALHYLTAFGPAVAALIVAWVIRQPGGRTVQRNAVRHSGVCGRSDSALRCCCLLTHNLWPGSPGRQYRRGWPWDT